MGHEPKIVAVDGPAGSGKSSICVKVCQQLGWTHVNTGVLYRSIGYLVDQLQVPLDEEVSLEMLVLDFNENFKWNPETKEIFYKDKNLTPFLEDEIAGKNASKVAQLPRLRELLLQPQRTLALSSPEGAIIDGRDIGTVVFPDAPLKLFMTASLKSRAARRYKQLQESEDQIVPSLEEIESQIGKRDEQDEGRAVAPLKQAGDAVLVDSTDMGFDQTVAFVVDLIKERFYR